METETKDVHQCEHCHVEMEKKAPEAKDLDPNNLSLLAMFRMNDFTVLQCPSCHRTGIYL